MTDWNEEDRKREGKMRDAVVRPLFGDKPITARVSIPGFCSHDFVVILQTNMQQPAEVRCRSCKEKLDPLLVLVHLARAWDNATYASQELATIATRVEELKREEQNIKSRLRSARKKTDTTKSDLFFEELLRRINAAQTYADRHEITRWQHSFAWLEGEQNSALCEAWRQAERRFEDHARQAKKLQRAGVKVLAGGVSE